VFNSVYHRDIEINDDGSIEIEIEDADGGYNTLFTNVYELESLIELWKESCSGA